VRCRFIVILHMNALCVCYNNLLVTAIFELLCSLHFFSIIQVHASCCCPCIYSSLLFWLESTK
jgi:hypothetical protein